MRAGLILAAAVLALASGAVLAQDLKAKGCLGCHDVDKKKVGPSLKDIAARRKGQEAELVAKLKEGTGHPKIAASDAELKALVQAVLATK